MTTTPPPADFLAFLEAGRREYRAAAPARLDALDAMWARACAGETQQLQDLERAAHSIAGSAGVFGLEGASRAGHELEGAVRRLSGAQDADFPVACAEVAVRLAAVRDAFAAGPS